MSTGGRISKRWLRDAEVRMEIRGEAFAAGTEAGAVEEREHWHRTPGTYRTDEATEVVVDLPESLAWLGDEFPDEVNAIVTAALTALRARAGKLDRFRDVEDESWNMRPDPRGDWVLWEDVLAALGGEGR
jgi:hypothetical protein